MTTLDPKETREYQLREIDRIGAARALEALELGARKRGIDLSASENEPPLPADKEERLREIDRRG